MGVELAVGNAASHWKAMARARGWACVDGPGFLAVRSDNAHRVLLAVQPIADAAALRRELLAVFREWDSRQLCLEDPTQALDLTDLGFEAALTMPLMVRDPGAPETPSRGQWPTVPVPAVAPARELSAERSSTGDPVTDAGLSVGEALREEDRAAVERVVVEGFPILQRLPWRRGEQFPAHAVVPGQRSWLARVDGRPAAACVTHDDGVAVGFYWVATLPEFRSRGAGRAVMRAGLAAHPDRPATLTATLLGEPLYRRLGFTERGLARWWQFPATPAELRR
ncbi:GNAT family N-acetyltransferase [Streptacidiphilus neutrinimicus]|uniref:GNAT family N-acetyltransferase n=1 Tax=Streptacidiphilus neutrinimicus TaxID=105420 RepID=UPI000AC131DC|nr:GNAT family N-acetyltransferase [Streptacidiphilus neutrinimicus]